MRPLWSKARYQLMVSLTEAWGVLLRLVLPPCRTVVVSLAGCIVAVWLHFPQGVRDIAAASFALFLIDTITGSWLALRDKRFASRCFGRSLTKLVVYLLALLAAVPMGTVLRLDETLLLIILFLVAAREGSSVIENTADLGFPWPKWIIERLKKLEDSCNIDPASPQGEENTDGRKS